MCLTKISDEKIATNDLITLKMLTVKDYNGAMSYRGYYRYNFEYQFEKVFKINRRLAKKNNKINIGYHSLAKNDKISSIFISSQLRKKSKLNKSKPNNYYYYYNALVLCVIPKGSSYYIGDQNDIVSDSIILLEDISDKVFKKYKTTTSAIKEGFKYIEDTYGKQNY